MSAFMRFLPSLSRLRRYVGDRRRALRRGARFKARLPLTVSPLRDMEDSAAAPGVEGVTRDLGATGITLLLPAMRVGSAYLTDSSGYLGVSVETPLGTVRMLASPVRFEQVEADEDGYLYLIGARIVGMSEDDRSLYFEALGALASGERRAGWRAAETAPADWPGLTPAHVSEAFERFLARGKVR